MGGFLKDLEQFVLGAKDNTFYRCLAYGIIFSLVMTLIIGNIEQVFSFTTSFPYVNVVTQAYWVGIVFVSFSLLFAFFGYINDLRARDDILSPLRKMLTGYWEVKAQAWNIDHGEVELDSIKQYCTIGIDAIGRKLILHFDLEDNDIFKNQSIDVVDVHIRYQTEPKRLVYYHESEIALRDPIGGGRIKFIRSKCHL